MSKEVDIFILGDSITYGTGDNEKCGWVNRLRLNLEENDNRVNDIFNLGIPGDNSEGLKRRFELEFETRKDEDNEYLIIFSIGVNDTQDVNGKDRVTLEQYENNILYLLSTAKKHTNNIVFLGLTKVDKSKVVPLPWSKSKSYFNRKITLFDNKLKEICTKNNIKYISMYDELSLNELSDGLHPNSIGHQKICNKVNEFINDLV